MLSVTHCLICLKFFSFIADIKLFSDTSWILTSIPESILPDKEYLCNSLRTRLQSGICFIISSAITGSSYPHCSELRIWVTRAINDEHSSARSFFLTLNSTTEHLECSGSMILFLKLQVIMNLQLLLNSSMNPLSAGWVDWGFR